jgi:hypothetical protein
MKSQGKAGFALPVKEFEEFGIHLGTWSLCISQDIPTYPTDPNVSSRKG